jgi:hypothetical protein
MPQDDEVKARMSKALDLARACLANAYLVSPQPLRPLTGTPPGQGDPEAVPIAILAAELYKHVEL